MSDYSWGLVIPVLLLGLTVGVVWVLVARSRSRSAPRSSGRDRELLVADLRARQELLYEQLRVADEGEREELELAAARNLKALEEAGGRAPAREASEAAATAGESVSRPTPRAPSAVVGFVGGVACAALVGVLVIWAQRDAKPRPDAEGPAPMADAERHPEGAQLSDREADALERIAAAVDNDPTDIMARKQYAVALLSTGQFFAAFEQSQILLGSDPGDPDGLYVQGMVRMRMGQEGEAMALLERLIADYPEHVPALTALGVLVLRSGGLEAAEALWDRAVEASGGENQEVEQLRLAARQQMTQPADAPPTAPVAAPAPAGAPGSFTVRIDLGPGATVAPGSVLFVSLRQGESGPPAAVKRIAGPTFPLTVMLGAADSMLGRPLPDAGTITARLDADGNVSTRAAGEPEGQVDLAAGGSASLTLQ